MRLPQFWILSIALLLFKSRRFGEWILSLSSWTYSVGPKYVNLSLTSGERDFLYLLGQLIGFHLKTGTESSLRNVVFFNKRWIVSRIVIAVITFSILISKFLGLNLS
jgi:hypothetical protein